MGAERAAPQPAHVKPTVRDRLDSTRVAIDQPVIASVAAGPASAATHAALHLSHLTAVWRRHDTVLGLQRCHGNRHVVRLLDRRTGPALSRATDQHAGAQELDAAQQKKVDALLNPTSTGSGGVSVSWDGEAVKGVLTKKAANNRAALRAELTAALKAHLAKQLPDLKKVAAARRLPMTSFEGAGKAAKQVTDAHFGDLTTAAAWTPGQATEHSTFQFQGSGPDQNLFDAYDPAQRKTAGHAIDPDDLAGWMAETDDVARAAADRHHFNPLRSGDEETFLRDQVLKPFVAANKADLELYDTFGFAISGDRIVAPSSVTLGLSDKAGSGGEPSPAERSARWGAWKLLVHEYIHKLEHPAFGSASRGNRIMKEGFCELFTKEVLLAELPGAPANAAIRDQVEGGTFAPPPANIVGGYDPGMYKFYLEQSEKIRDKAIGGKGGANAVKAAFFQGHVEFLGLTPRGAAAAPATGGADSITVPAGITTVAALAVATGVAEADILAANVGLKAAGPLPATVRAPGCRDHVVVEATALMGRAKTAETKTQIATQNGVAPADLDRANPGLNWAALTAGQRILIPKH